MKFKKALSDIEFAVVQQVVCWLLRLKAWVRIPGKASKRNMEKKYISSAISSHQISGKNSECQNKIAMKKFPKNLAFGVNVKPQVLALMHEINAYKKVI